uniref:Peptidase S1 domain-containing protein n=1 Tax=Glossina brevipalpis TaxID=37001 RepID=A0A1A9WXP5_9MUSC
MERNFVSAMTFKRHTEYDNLNKTNDVAIIRLAVPLVFSSKIKPIELATVDPVENASAKEKEINGGEWKEEKSERQLMVGDRVLHLLPSGGFDDFNYYRYMPLHTQRPSGQTKNLGQLLLRLAMGFDWCKVLSYSS